MPTLLEICQARQIPFTGGIIEAVETAVPALMAFDTRTTSGTKFQALARTSLPTASGFKDYNQGATAGAASFALREFQAKLLLAKVQVEMVTAARWDAEKAVDAPSYFDLQVQATMQSEMKNLEKCLFYGTSQDAKAFPGLKQLTPYVTANVLTLTEDPGATDYIKTVINAAGTTSSTASSVYSVVHGVLDCQLVVCNDNGGELLGMTEPFRQALAPDSNSPTATLEYMLAQISGHFGVSVSGMNQTPNSVVPTQYSVRRLANLTEDSGKGVTDAKLEQLVLSHGDGIVPSRLYMNGRSARQWADSRSASTATLFLGMSGDARNNIGSLRAKRPDNFEGIPVTYTSAIASNDAIES